MAQCFNFYHRKEVCVILLSILIKIEPCFMLLEQKSSFDHYSTLKYLCFSKIKSHFLFSSAEWNLVIAKQFSKEFEGFGTLQH